jgi:hypothetical protein
MDPISFFCLFKNPQREVVSNQKTRLWSGRRTYVLTGNENEGHRLDNGDFRFVVARFSRNQSCILIQGCAPMYRL